MINLPSNYFEVLSQIKSSIHQTHYQAVKAVNYQLFDLYWSIGEKLANESKNNWGQSIVQKLSQDLQAEFNGIKGFSAQNLWLMKQLYEEYKQFPNLQQLAREIGWTSNFVILQKVKQPKQREFYLQKTQQENWSRATLKQRISKNEYENHKNSLHNLDQKLTTTKASYVWEIKDEYHFEFLELEEEHSERQFEDGLVKNITKTLGQFGRDFSFMGRQFKLQASDKEYFVDLLFYHRKLKCLIAIELKTKAFEISHTQQLNLYLHILDKQVKYEDDNPSIGILICRDKDKILVEYALELATNPMGVASYTYNDLPEEIAKNLPSEAELENIFKENLEDYEN